MGQKAVYITSAYICICMCLLYYICVPRVRTWWIGTNIHVSIVCCVCPNPSWDSFRAFLYRQQGVVDCTSTCSFSACQFCLSKDKRKSNVMHMNLIGCLGKAKGQSFLNCKQAAWALFSLGQGKLPLGKCNSRNAMPDLSNQLWPLSAVFNVLYFRI